MKLLPRKPLILVFILYLPLPAYAILLDCETNPDGSYHCIEITNSGNERGAESAPINHGEAYSRYLEQARSQCTYKEPRKRAGGKISGAAHRSEELKAARKTYERCVSEKARALRQQDKASGN